MEGEGVQEQTKTQTDKTNKDKNRGREKQACRQRWKLSEERETYNLEDWDIDWILGWSSGLIKFCAKGCGGF